MVSPVETITRRRRLADEYDAAQDRGEVAKIGDNLPSVPKQNSKPIASDLGISRKDIHEARIIRDAEVAARAWSKRRSSKRSKPASFPLTSKWCADQLGAGNPRALVRRLDFHVPSGCRVEPAVAPQPTRKCDRADFLALDGSEFHVLALRSRRKWLPHASGAQSRIGARLTYALVQESGR